MNMLEPNRGSDDHDIARLHLAVIAAGSALGLIYPIFFLGAHLVQLFSTTFRIPIIFFVLPLSGQLLAGMTLGALLLATLGYLAAGGELFRKLSEKGIKWTITGWNTLNLLLVGALVYATGGTQSSILGWLFEYVLVVMLVIRPTHKGREKKGMARVVRHWGPAIVTGVLEFLIIAGLIDLGRKGLQQPSFAAGPMSVWGGFSLLAALIFTAFLFAVSENVRREGVGVSVAALNHHLAEIHMALNGLAGQMAQITGALRRANLIQDEPPTESSSTS